MVTLPFFLSSGNTVINESMMNAMIILVTTWTANRKKIIKYTRAHSPVMYTYNTHRGEESTPSGRLKNGV